MTVPFPVILVTILCLFDGSTDRFHFVDNTKADKPAE